MSGPRARLLSAMLWLLLALPVFAENMLMARIPLRAEITLEYVKSSIEEHGYAIAHLQLCDGGMADFGYESDVYRVIFFGKIDEVRSISEHHPELVSYLPLKIAVIAERDETLLVALDPEALSGFYTDGDVRIQLGRWHNDIRSVFADVRGLVSERLAARQ